MHDLSISRLLEASVNSFNVLSAFHHKLHCVFSLLGFLKLIEINFSLFKVIIFTFEVYKVMEGTV